MIRLFSIVGLIILVFGSAGCRCRSCNQSYFSPLAGFGSTRINPPATGAFAQPTGQPNNYYNPGATATLPNNQLPPTTGQQNGNLNWKAIGNSSSGIPNGSGPIAYSPPAGYPTNYTTLASNSTIRSTDFRTTPNNDPSRMPVSDASGIRAPARFVPNQVAFAQNQPIQIRGQYQYQAQPRLYSVPNQVLANSSTAAPYQPGYPNNFANQNAVQANWQASGQNNVNR